MVEILVQPHSKQYSYPFLNNYELTHPLSLPFLVMVVRDIAHVNLVIHVWLPLLQIQDFE